MTLTLYKLEDAATELGVAPSTLRHQLRLGRWKAVKIGYRWFATPDQITWYRKHRKRES